MAMAIQRIGDRDVILTDRLPSVSQEDVQLLVRRLHAAILSYGLYPPGHTIIIKRTKDLHAYLEKIFKHAPLLVIRCEQSLAVNNTRLLRDVPEKEQSMKIASYLGLRGVKNVVIWPLVEHGELGELIQTWHSINEEEEEESYDWVQQYRSYHVRLNMDLVDSVELEAAAHGGHQAPIAISKQELADILAQIGPDSGSGQGSQGRPSTSQIQLVDDSSGHGASGHGSSYGHSQGSMPGSMSGSMSGVSGPVQAGEVVQAQHVLQHVGGQVVQAQQVIQQYSGSVSPEYAGMTYPPRQGQGPSHAPSGGVAERVSGHSADIHRRLDSTPESHYAGLQYAQPVVAPGGAQHPSVAPQHARPGTSPQNHLGSSSGYVEDPLQGYQPGSSPGYAEDPLLGYQASAQSSAETRLPPGLLQPAAYHPARQNQLPHNDLPTAPEPSAPWYPQADINPMAPADSPYSPSREEKTVVHRMPGSSSVNDLLRSSRLADPNRGTGQFMVSEVTPSVEDLPEIQGYVLDEPFANSAGASGSEAYMPPLSGIDSPAAMRGYEEPAGIPMGYSVSVEVEQLTEQVPGFRAPASGVQWSATSNYALPQDWVTVDPVSLDQSNLDLSQLDFGKIEPGSLFQSQRFREFLGSGGTGLFLSRFLATIMGAGTGLQPGHMAAVASEGGWLGTGAGRALLGAVEQLEGDPLQQALVHSLAETISSTIPELMDEQLALLGQSKSEQLLRKEVMQQISPERRPMLSELLLERLQRANHPERIDTLMTTMSMLTENSLDGGLWRSLVPTLELLAQRKEQVEEDPQLAMKWEEWLDKMASPSVGRVLFQQLLRSKDSAVREDARRGILAMGVASAYNLTLFLELANDSHSEQLLLSLVREIGESLDEVGQTLFFDQLWSAGEALPPARHVGLCQAIYKCQSNFVEKHIADKFDYLEKTSDPTVTEADWLRWIGLALRCHTPRLRQYLGRYLQQRRFLAHREVEERILRLLDGHGTIQGFQFLEHIIHNERQNNQWKTSAVWLLGCLRSEEALLLLRRILLERRRFLRQPVYPADMRYQALDTLRHFPRHQVLELVKKVRQDPDESLRDYAQKMLDSDALN